MEQRKDRNTEGFYARNFPVDSGSSVAIGHSALIAGLKAPWNHLFLGQYGGKMTWHVVFRIHKPGQCQGRTNEIRVS